MAFDSIEPIGDRRRDIQTAIVASTLANIHRDRKARSEPFAPEDFVPAWWDEEPNEKKASPQASPQLISFVEDLNRMFGGRDLRRKEGEGDDAGTAGR